MQRFSDTKLKKNVIYRFKTSFKVMKKIMFVAAIALCAMSCGGNKAEKACDKQCCQEAEAVVAEEVVAEEVVDSAAVVVEEVVEAAEAVVEE